MENENFLKFCLSDSAEINFKTINGNLATLGIAGGFSSCLRDTLLLGCLSETEDAIVRPFR
jgi:hypothetical protein